MSSAKRTFYFESLDFVELELPVLNVSEIEHDHLDDHILDFLDIVDIVFEHDEQRLNEACRDDLQEIILEQTRIILFDLRNNQCFQLILDLMIMRSVAVENHNEDFLGVWTQHVHDIRDDLRRLFLVLDVRDVQLLVKRFQVIDGFLGRQQDRIEQCFFIFEIPINVTNGNPGTVRNASHVGVLVAVFEKLADCAVQDGFFD